MVKLNLHRGIFLLFMVFACGPVCDAAPGNEYLPLAAIAQKHHLKAVVNRPDRVILRSEEMELIFKPQARTFHANNVLMPLGFSTEVRTGKLCVTHADYSSHICPFLVKRCQNSAQRVTIVLDPGHGGRDDGTAAASGLKEKIVTLDICQKLAQFLTKQGYAVHLTRSEDRYVELEERAKFANQKSANLFVSVHCNAAETRLAHGIETFTLTPHGQPSQHKTKFSQSALKPYDNNRFDGENLMLAYNVQRILLRRTRGADRGVKHANFRVLMDLNCPAILVECGFLSNALEKKKLASEEYRWVIAQAIADGIITSLK
ncbi:MAG: N-acetylmuramoyl-L-alanine amidase [Puniceicoccales bacterium]|jgi:N-acetylmuramoyl-L-alanine amidase|nr:N-acetylmuramoyl-L-alanine amidase [Puniceicoccales bacterium]